MVHRGLHIMRQDKDETIRHRRTGQHPFGGGQTAFCPNGFGGGGVVAEIFRDPYSVGGGGRNFPRPIRWAGGVVAELFPLTAVTDPRFVLFKHVLCFARIMSTLCPNVCRQTARIEGRGMRPLPPAPYAYAIRSSMVRIGGQVGMQVLLPVIGLLSES